MSLDQYKKMAVMRQYVGYKHAYYMFVWGNIKHRFMRFSWNWAAFLFGFVWLAYRKMYGYALLLFMLFALCVMPSVLYAYCLNYSDTLSVWFCNTLAALPFHGFVYVSPEQIDSFMKSAGSYLMMLPFIPLLICGIYGNYMYLRAIRRKLRKIDDCYNENERTIIISRYGGVSHASLFVAFLLFQALLILMVMIRRGTLLP